MTVILKAIVAAAALIALIGQPVAPRAAADDGSPALIQSGGVLCAVSASDAARGGGPTAICQLADGGPFPQAPFSTTKPYPKLNLAVVRGSGVITWELGSVAGGQPVNLGTGQTYHVNGWTIQFLGPQTTYVWDVGKRGISVGTDLVHSVWL